MMPSRHSSRLRSASVSSMRKMKTPPLWCDEEPVEERRARGADVHGTGR